MEILYIVFGAVVLCAVVFGGGHLLGKNIGPLWERPERGGVIPDFKYTAPSPPRPVNPEKIWVTLRFSVYNLQKGLDDIQKEGGEIKHLQGCIDNFGLQETLVVYCKKAVRDDSQYIPTRDTSEPILRG